jgi:hypothetical protein
VDMMQGEALNILRRGEGIMGMGWGYIKDS